jgi:hypothetical protein
MNVDVEDGDERALGVRAGDMPHCVQTNAMDEMRANLHKKSVSKK